MDEKHRRTIGANRAASETAAGTERVPTSMTKRDGKDEKAISQPSVVAVQDTLRNIPTVQSCFLGEATQKDIET